MSRGVGLGDLKRPLPSSAISQFGVIRSLSPTNRVLGVLILVQEQDGCICKEKFRLNSLLGYARVHSKQLCFDCSRFELLYFRETFNHVL